MKNPFILTCLLSLSCQTMKADWLNFRGPSGTGIGVDCEQVPTQLSEDSLQWKIDLPGRGLGSPVVVGDQIFISAATGPEQKQLHIICYSNGDGSKLWERRFRATGRTMCHKKTCVAAPSPASDGKSVFVLFSSNDLIALDLDGNLQWMRGLTIDYPNASNSLGMSSSPIVSGEILVVQIENDSESFAAGIDTHSGLNHWKLNRPKAANWTSPILMEMDGNQVAVLQSSRGILGVHPTTGSNAFEFKNGAATIPSSVADKDVLYIPSNGLTAVKAHTNGSESTKLWNQGAQRPGTASPIIIDRKVYTINGAGVLTCANQSTGERLSRLRLKGPISSSPVAAANHLFVFSEKGLGQCVDLRGPEGKIVSEFDLNQTILSTPALSNHALYIRSDNALWKFAN